MNLSVIKTQLTNFEMKLKERKEKKNPSRPTQIYRHICIYKTKINNTKKIK